MTRVGVLRGSNRPSMRGGDYHIALDQKIPVYITYFTLRVNDDGSFTTFNDIYRYDARMDAALNGKGYLPDPWATDEEMADNQSWGTVPNMRYRMQPGRNGPFPGRNVPFPGRNGPFGF
jgi:hypothetical protein